MKHIDYIEYLVLKTKLKGFIEKLNQDESKVYQSLAVKIPVRWMTLLHLLYQRNEPITITQAASQLNRTHPDVHLINKQMLKENLVQNTFDQKDRRKRLMQLSPKGIKEVEKLLPIWEATEAATQKWIEDKAPDFMLHLEALENSMLHQSFYDRIIHEIRAIDYASVKIKSYSSDDKLFVEEAYQNWSKKKFRIREIEESLENLRKYVFNNGGQILIAEKESQNLGFALIIRQSYHVARIAGLWTHRKYRKRQIGHRLLDATIEFTRDIGCKYLLINLNRIMVAAEYLVKKKGFTISNVLNKNYPPYENSPLSYIMELD